MNHSLDDIRILARAYLNATGISSYTLSRKVTGAANSQVGNDKLIGRILDGKGCTMAMGEAMSGWFEANWPAGIPWPSEVPRYNSQCSEAAE